VDGSQAFIAITVVSGLSLVAFSMRILDAAGAIAAWILGLIVSVSGGILWLIPMAVFTGSSYVATRYGRAQKQQFAPEESERSAQNVFANGFAPAIAALATWFVNMEAAALAYVAALAATTADTWASEIGILSKQARQVLPPFQPGNRGENGMVSALGQTAALSGALLVSVAGFWALDMQWNLLAIPLLAGFMGSQIDSVLGLLFERNVNRPGVLGNSSVNLISSLLPTIVVLVVAAFVWA
jgi:uncharacterized protein (TIGR00297 family)